MTIAVLGATGHLGSLTLDHLLTRGTAPADLRAIGRDAAKLVAWADRGVPTAVADFDRPETLGAALAGVDVLLLVSGNALGRRVQQHQGVIDAAKAAGVQRLVYTSAPHATTTDLVLAAEHKATEEALVGSGLTYTVLRNNWYTENYRQDFDGARESGVIAQGVGLGRIASAPRSEYAEAAAVVLTGDGFDDAVLELSGDTAWTFEDFAAAAATALGRPVEYQPQSADAVSAHLASTGADEGTIGFVVALNGGIEGGALADATTTLAGLLGHPTTPLAVTLGEWAAAS